MVGLAPAAPERGDHPVAGCVKQGNRWLAPSRPYVEIDHDHHAAVLKGFHVMPENLRRCCEMEQDQPTDDCIERFWVAIATDVGLDESHVLGDGCQSALLGDDQHGCGLIHSHDFALRSDELSYHEGHVSEAGAQVEHADTRPDACSRQKERGGCGDTGCLGVQSSQFSRRRPKRVRLRFGHRSNPPLSSTSEPFRS